MITKPGLSDGRAWKFWQYTNRGTLKGYNGKEKYIDINVFNGGTEEYKLYLQNNAYRAGADGDYNA